MILHNLRKKSECKNNATRSVNGGSLCLSLCPFSDTIDCRLTISHRPDTVSLYRLLFALALGATTTTRAAPCSCEAAALQFKKYAPLRKMTSEPIIDEYDGGPTTWEQLVPVCILTAILLILLIACLKECHFKYNRRKVRDFCFFLLLNGASVILGVRLLFTF